MTLSRDEPLVVDASVAVKWVVPEPDSAQAALLLDHSLVAPDLLFAECANILWKKVMRGELSAAEAADLRLVTADSRLIDRVRRAGGRFPPRLAALSEIA